MTTWKVYEALMARERRRRLRLLLALDFLLGLGIGYVLGLLK